MPPQPNDHAEEEPRSNAHGAAESRGVDPQFQALAENLRAGAYTLLRPVRRDRDTISYMARASNGRLLAVHRWLGLANSEPLQRELIEETTRYSRIRHPNLAEAVEGGTQGDRPFLATELPDGDSLHHLLARRGPFSSEEAVRLVFNVAEAVHALHEGGVLHRRIRPANIHLTRHGRPILWPPRFLAAGSPNWEEYAPAEALGIVQYLAPEAISRERAASERSDVYSLAATLYTLITGELPFPADDLGKCLCRKNAHQLSAMDRLRELAPAGVAAAVAGGLHPDPRHRPASAQRFAELLTDGLESIGRYTLLERVGKGESGDVFRARDGKGTIVALKVLNERSGSAKRRLVRFYQEARLSMQVDHPNVVKALEVGKSDGRHFIAMDYIEGENLARHVMRSGVLRQKDALRLAIDVAGALAALHDAGIIHRDVNPNNILVAVDGRAVLADLGLSKSEADFDLTRAGAGLGTLPYMAPEQFHRAADVDGRCDIYSLGATLYTMLTGELPFQGTLSEVVAAKVQNRFASVRERNPAVSPALAKLIRGCMHPNPAGRPQEVRRFIAFASACLVSVSPRPKPRPAPRPAAPPNDSQWHVVFFNQSGRPQRLRATAAQIIGLVRAGRLGADARAALAGQGEYLPLHRFQTFQELFQTDRKTGKPRRSSLAAWSSRLRERFFSGRKELTAVPVEMLPATQSEKKSWRRFAFGLAGTNATRGGLAILTWLLGET